ncbi:hypothetical protein LXL04_030150 [Taraxacum kok-saghyz]
MDAGKIFFAMYQLLISFPRLYAFETCKSAKVDDRVSMDLPCWPWRRAIRLGREMEEADGLTLMLSNVTLNQGKDKWMIPESDNGRFTTKWIGRKIEHFRIQF